MRWQTIHTVASILSRRTKLIPPLLPTVTPRFTTRFTTRSSLSPFRRAITVLHHPIRLLLRGSRFGVHYGALTVTASTTEFVTEFSGDSESHTHIHYGFRWGTPDTESATTQIRKVVTMPDTAAVTEFATAALRSSFRAW